MQCIYAIIGVKYSNDARINFGEGVTLEMMNDQMTQRSSNYVGTLSTQAQTFVHRSGCMSPFLIFAFYNRRLRPLVTTDPQSNTPLGEADRDSRPEKTWPVKRTLVSNEVNCIAADSENVWIATARGVSRWERQQDQWLHYTMEMGWRTIW